MSYEGRKEYIEQTILKNSSQMEHLMKFAENKISNDTKTHVNRVELQRHRDIEKLEAIAKRDPLYDYY